MMNEPHPPPFHETPERATYDLPQVAALLGVSRTSVYRWANNGTVPAVRVGRRLLVPRAALVDLLTPELARDEDESRIH